MILRLSNISILLYIFTWAIFFLSFLLGENNYRTFSVLICLSFMGLVHCVALKYSRATVIPLVIFYALINYVFVFLQIAILSYFPTITKYFQTALAFRTDQVADTLLYIRIFSICFYIGLFFHKKTRGKIFDAEKLKEKFKKNYVKLLILGIIPVFFNLYISFVSGSGRGRVY
jgi:hypothetical protein